MKICSNCGKEKEESNFSKDKRSKDGLTSQCKDCFKEHQRKYRKTENYKKALKKYHRTDKYNKYQIEYQKTDKLKKYKREYSKERRIVDAKFKLNSNMRTAIRLELRGKKAGRKWKSLVNYTIDDLMNHLESKFESWMNWDNYGKGVGKWSVDHIKPVSLFNYTCPEDEEFKKCWSLDNLQPLDYIKNIIKSNKYGEQ